MPSCVPLMESRCTENGTREPLMEQAYVWLPVITLIKSCSQVVLMKPLHFIMERSSTLDLEGKIVPQRGHEWHRQWDRMNFKLENEIWLETAMVLPTVPCSSCLSNSGFVLFDSCGGYFINIVQFFLSFYVDIFETCIQHVIFCMHLERHNLFISKLSPEKAVATNTY